jgi:hypothetical protein
MLIAIMMMLISDTSFTTTKYARVESTINLVRLHKRGKLVISGEEVLFLRGIIRVPIDSYYDTRNGTFSRSHTEGAIPLSYRWGVSGDTIFCGKSLFFVRKSGFRKKTCITNFPNELLRVCRVDFSGGVVFVRYLKHTDIYTN